MPCEVQRLAEAKSKAASPSAVVSWRWPVRLAASSAPQAASAAGGSGAVRRAQCCVTATASKARRRVRSAAFSAESSSRSWASGGRSRHSSLSTTPADSTLPSCDANRVERAALAGTCRNGLKSIACERSLVRDTATASAIGGAAHNCSSAAWCMEIASRMAVHDDSASLVRCPSRVYRALASVAVLALRGCAGTPRARRSRPAAPPIPAFAVAKAIDRCCSVN